MYLPQTVQRDKKLPFGKRCFALLMTLFAFLSFPTFAFAAGGEANIKLEFTEQDKMYLYISLGFGVVALAFAAFFWSWVKKQSPGNEKMQEVGGAIRAGALAYLRQQVQMMGVFVAIISIGLFFMYLQSYGGQLAGFTVAAFVGGVAASYIAGYVGMYAAVSGNMRVAHSALTSYKTALEIAFRSGAVAGLVTVGMGLLGATIIFLGFPENATKLLVGFGFGGSLAALFMRVGGGIFTKAADVGADLVGKVEAGIPEDDPRNPAVIADNVGDNVGDCAGMAADVFESYEVTLVAAIVLGAATAAIFPTEIWMKLILFAMMARGVGILASIVGIFMVRGEENITFDPLKAIRRGFYSSAAIAAVATVGLAWFMLGGADKTAVVKTSELVTLAEIQRDRAEEILKIQRQVAAKEGVELYQVKPETLLEDARIKKLNIPADQLDFQVRQAMAAGERGLPVVENIDDFRPINYSNDSLKILRYAAPDTSNPAQGAETPNFRTFKAAYEKADLKVFSIEAVQTPVGPDGKPLPGEPQKQEFNFGPVDKADFEKQLAEAAKNSPNSKFNVTAEYPVTFYTNPSGELIAGVSVEPTKLDLGSIQSGPVAYADTPEKVKAFSESQAANQTEAAPQPPAVQAEFAYVKHKVADFWRFALCVLFGIVMAFVFEWLTDYYVGLHKRPVKELGQLATAGPAPMIITGFAYGKESSVFSVFAIVACLIGPLLIFPPAEYGGYLLSFYGIALVGLGLLTTTGFILAMDTFGPISDNAQGVFEMSGAGEESEDGARRVQLLDAAGNTTKALTKGFAIATAVVAAVALFHAYVEEGKLTQIGMRLEVPEIFLGLLIGGAAPYLFSAFSINAVGRAAFQLINNVRAQFRNDPGIMAGTSKPDYASCVQIVTKAAQTELLGPGILAIAFPVLVAFGFAIGKPLVTIDGAQYNLVGAQALGGFLAGTILSGQLMAVLLANSGGMWDNAKKLIEDGLHGGKGTEAHKAAVVCDTVGDPFKDTAGPALNPLIKVMNLVALLLAPQVIKPWDNNTLVIITLAAAAALVVAIWWSKRGSMSDGLNEAPVDKQPSIVEMAKAQVAETVEDVKEKAEDLIDGDKKPDA